MEKNVTRKRTDLKEIGGDEVSKVYIGINVIEAITTEKMNTNIKNYKKVSGNSCVNLATGECIEFSKERKPEQKQTHIIRAANELRRIINNNFKGDDSEVFLTLTYRKPMKDYSQANKDFLAFWNKFKYYYKTCDYIRVIEPQGNGSWHFHVLIKSFKTPYLFIDKAVVSKLWTHGSFKIKRLPFVDNFGAYFCASFKDNNENASEKALLKGKRLNYYPENFKLYTCSYGIQKPLKTYMTHQEFEDMVEFSEKCYSCTTAIEIDGVEVNTITYEQYKMEGCYQNVL